jgi:glutathione S-transferase
VSSNVSVFDAFQRPLFEGGTEIKQQTVSELHEILNFIDEYYFPNDNEWIAGENITAADFAYASTIEGLVVSFKCFQRREGFIYSMRFGSKANARNCYKFVEQFNYFRRLEPRWTNIRASAPGISDANPLFPTTRRLMNPAQSFLAIGLRSTPRKASELNQRRA